MRSEQPPRCGRCCARLDILDRRYCQGGFVTAGDAESWYRFRPLLRAYSRVLRSPSIAVGEPQPPDTAGVEPVADDGDADMAVIFAAASQADTADSPAPQRDASERADAAREGGWPSSESPTDRLRYHGGHIG